MIEIHVSPSAESGGDGSASTPFNRIESARDAIRALRSQGESTDAVTVLLHEGLHRLSETLTLSAEDSGTERSPVVYRGAPGERAVISGGEVIGDWAAGEDGVWTASVDGSERIRSFRVGNKDAVLARYPSCDPTEPRTGGWLFAQWWGDPWERGNFHTLLRGLRHAGNSLEWDVAFPSAGKYAVWAAYAKPQDDDVTLTVLATDSDSNAAGDTEGDNEISITLQKTAGGRDHRIEKVGDVEIHGKEATVRLANVSGGDFALSCLLLTDDQEWDPVTGVAVLEHWGKYRIGGLEEGATLRILQAEAFSRSTGTDIIKPRSEPPGKTDRVVAPEGGLPRWSRWDLVDVHIFPAWGWVNSIINVIAADHDASTLWVDCGFDIRPGNRYFLAGTPEAMSDPGEFFHDPHAEKIGYLPREPGELEANTAVAARMTTLIRITGKHIAFEDLVFSDTDYTAPGGGYGPDDAALVFSGAESCAVTRCRFEHIGGYAARLEERSSSIRITENHMHGLGAGGIMFVGKDGTQPFENEILANEISDCGRIYKHVAGVYVTSGSKNRVAYNRISGMPRYAISVKSGEGNSSHENIIEYNDIRDTNLETNDTGAIETLGRDKKTSGNVIRFNRILNTVGLKTTQYGEFMTPHYTWGIYLDDFSSGTTIYGNIVDGCVLGGVNIHGGMENIVENNILLNGSERQISFSPYFKDPNEKFMQNNRVVRNIVAGGKSEHFLFAPYGRWYKGVLSECDFNLYWRTDGSDLESDASATPVGSIAEWREDGLDTNSLCADPRLSVDKDGFAVPDPDSPAWKLGFERIPVELIGPRGYRHGGSGAQSRSS